MASRTPRVLFSLTLFLGSCALIGSLVGGKVAAQSASDESTLRDSLHQFTDVYSLVEQNYAEHLDGDMVDKAIYDGAIPGMLHVLDPHSNFYDPKAFAQMREDQHGKYYGVGMSIQPMPDKNGTVHVVVLAPFEGTPAFKAGIKPGDAILAIDGKSADGLDSTAVASMLKGPKGTHVGVTMAREGHDQPLNFDLVRDEIPRYSVDVAFMVKPGIGYIHVTNFMETTSREVGDALDKFEAANGNLHGLIVDLRGNPGGLLNEAVNVSDKFLAKGQVVVSQRGRAFHDQVYTATRGEEGSTKYPIVVIVNRNTASAAEIVSGALQDHDRALIVGETTFGKGLVQTVFPIAEDTGLALTTYHYYTPSGRLIQRDYSGESLYDYYYVRDDAKKADKSNTEVKLTDSGRTVYGGGGITPDEKIDVPELNRFQLSLYQHYIFVGSGFNPGIGNFGKHYLATHSITHDFVVDDAVLEQFKDFLHANSVEYTDADIAANQEWIKANIKTELFTSQFGQLEGLKVRAESDPEINKAVTYLPEALALVDRGNKGQQNTASLR
jgi:carboxyl-terminal processing protease